MAEPRRVQLTTLGCDGPSASHTPVPAQGSPFGAVQERDAPSDPATVRLSLRLFEPDERGCPEFSYSQLVDSQINQAKVPLSQLEEEERRENDEVIAIARKLEETYGGKAQGKKDRIQDLIDIGYGYDEEDSFIDNSEAYDEFVPASITTTFGGFYVNSGILHFRQASDTEIDELTPAEKTPETTKKRKLNGGLDKPKKKLCRAGGERKISTLSDIGQDNEMKKKKKAVKTLSVTSLLKKFQREKEKERQKMEKENQRVGATAPPLFPADAAGGGGFGLADPLLSLIGSTNDHTLIQAASTVDFDIDLDTLLDITDETSLPKSLPQPEPDGHTQLRSITDATVQAPNTKSDSQLKKPHPEQTQIMSESTSVSPPCAPLPEGLPPTLEESIRKFTMAAKTSEGESKLKFFNADINSILLNIELQCREQGGSLRSKVYTHLSSFLPCSRDTLLKRVKKLLVKHVEEPPGVEDAMQKLKEAIGRSMPAQITCFHEDCQAYSQIKTAKSTEDENVEEKVGKRGGPKKLFKWNEEIRECLGHVLREKMGKYKKEKNNGQEIEEYLKTLLDKEIKPLWPKGWMQSRVLVRESKKMLRLVTLPVKKAKSEKKQSLTSGASPHSDGPASPPALTADPPQGTHNGSRISTSVSVGVQKERAALKKGEVKKEVAAEFVTPAESNEPRVKATSAPTSMLLELPADEPLIQQQPHGVSLLVAAVAQYKHSLQHQSFGVDAKSPPPPPQSSPVGFPVSTVFQAASPQLLQTGEARHEGAVQVYVISDDECITIQ